LVTVRVRNSRSWLTSTVGAAALHELLEAVEPVDVEVVGRLVEQVGVVARQQQRGEAGARRLAARQRRHRQLEVDGEPEVGEHRGGALVEVGAAEREPALERRRE
jgi:hypothetical protein